MKTPFKDKLGRWRTRSLFKEFHSHNPEYPPVFTLKEYEEGGLPSVRQLFLSYKDPTGYKFAKEVLGSYEHWKKLLDTDWFPQYLEEWQAELEVKLVSDSLLKIKEISIGPSAQAFNAAKYLAEKGWEPVKQGRPKKSDKDKTAKVQAGIEAEVEEDLQRIRLVKG